MDRNYATPGFADPPPPPPPPPPAPPAAPAAASSASAQPPAPAWAYEPRAPAAASSPSCSGAGGSPSLKASLSYDEGHPSRSEPDLQRQTFAASHQLPGYAPTPQPTGLSGIFDTSVNSDSSNNKESSVMNFLSSVESRATQAASSGATLLPQFRAPSWQTGMHSSAATELFVTGPLPTTGTLPPPALSAYQHPTTFSNRNFATTSPLVLQDSSFNTAANGILNHHDPLLQIKTSQGTVPTALAFERLGSSALSNSIPPQSSTYRSAQESAPHLLQPQFSLLPSALGGAQQTPQAYSSTIFSSSTASIERALRECSVIKHHQRPSGTQSIPAQLTGSQHSLHSYLSNANVVNFQETSRQSSLSCSPIGESTQVSNGGLQQKNPQVSNLAQPYSTAVPSSGYPSTTKVDSCSTKLPLTSTKTPTPQSIIPPVQTLSYSKPLHNQSSVVSGQAQIYSTAQLPSLLSVSQSQNYGLVQPHNVPSIVHSQVYRSNRVEKLPSLYKTLAYSLPSQPITSENQTLSYSSSQQEVLSSITNENYPAQTRDLCSVSQSQSYSSGHSQGPSPVSPTRVSYSSQSQILSASPSESYASGQSLTLTAPSLSYSSASRAQNLSDSTSTPNYISMHSSQNAQTQQESSSSSPQAPKFLPTVQSSFVSSPHCQTLQSNIPSPDLKSYAERKLDSTVYTSSKQEDDFPMQELQTLQPQASLESSSQRLSEGEVNAQEPIYEASKVDDSYSQSVIRSNSHLEDQVVGTALQGSKKEENMVGPVTQLNQQISQPSNAVTPDLKKATSLMQTPQMRLNTKVLSQQHSLTHKVQEAKVQEQHDQIINASSHIQIPNHALGHTHQASLPNTQVLLDSACDLQVLQHSILQAGLGQVKSSLLRVQSPQQIVHPFLQMDGHIIQSNGDHSQQPLHPQNSEIMKLDLSQSSKPLQQHLITKGHFSETNQDSKSQFVSLGSICFPEAMLLSDERNILSNVDDILAATAAACGVTPSDFSKSTSNDTIQAVEGGDPKSHFQQSLDVRHVTSDFNSITPTVGKPQNINDISLNGNPVTVNLSPVPTLQSKMTLDQQHIETPGQNIPTKVTCTVVGPSHDIQEQSSGSFKKQSATNHESEEDNEVPVDSTLNNRNQEFVSSSRSISGESATSENEFTLGSDDSLAMNPTRSALALLAMAPPIDKTTAKMEEDSHDLIHFNLPKKKGKGKGQVKEEDNSNQKQLKRSSQGKRQNPRGTDAFLPYASPSSEGCHEGYQHQEKMRQKIKEVEEKQPEVKTGFIASFLDFLKSGPKQQFSTLAVRMPNRTRRPGTQIVRTFCPPPLPKTSSSSPMPLVSESGGISPTEKADNELKNLENLSSFSSDEEDPGVCTQDIYKSISTPLTALDATADKTKKTVSDALPVATPSPSTSTASAATASSASAGSTKPELLPSASSAINILENTNCTEPPKPVELDDLSSDRFAKGQDTVAIEGFTDEENTESGGEGQYRERDEFVVKIEDIETFKEALKIGKEPPAIWKVQKALLQKFVPEIRDGQREFAATNSYLGYFGDAKTKYKRIYVKFIENANKKEYVRVCSKKPRSKPSQAIRTVQAKPSNSNKTSDPPTSKTTTTSKAPSTKPKVKQLKIKAEPPPKKRKKWKEEFSSSQSDSSAGVHSSSSDDGEFDPPAPFVTRFLNTRAMKETFKSYMELLVSIALDPDTMQALEKSNDELLLPHMKKIDGMLNDNRKRLLLNLHLEQSFKTALESFPELTIITRESKAKSGGSAISKIKMNGKTYNKKTLRTSKTTTKSAQEFAVDPEKIQLYSLYHSLHHYKYHVYLICKNEISSVQKKNEDLGQEEIVQLCMKNAKWVEDLFEKFGELLNHVQQKCS